MKSTSFSVYSNLIVALVNDDISGLEDSDLAELDHLKKRITEEVGENWHAVCTCGDFNPSFSRPEIALNRNVWGDCEELYINYV